MAATGGHAAERGTAIAMRILPGHETWMWRWGSALRGTNTLEMGFGRGRAGPGRAGPGRYRSLGMIDTLSQQMPPFRGKCRDTSSSRARRHTAVSIRITQIACLCTVSRKMVPPRRPEHRASTPRAASPRRSSCGTPRVCHKSHKKTQQTPKLKPPFCRLNPRSVHRCAPAFIYH